MRTLSKSKIYFRLKKIFKRLESTKRVNLSNFTQSGNPITADIQYLCIGHCCHDKLGDDNILGGCASYASLVAHQLGLKVGILTSVGDDFEFFKVFEDQGIELLNKQAAKTTVFENIYHNHQRTQYIHAVAEKIYANDVPQEWLKVPVVHIGLIADEADKSVLKAFPNAIIGVTIQGWLRQWDDKGRVLPKAMDWSLLADADVVIMSDADIEGFEELLPLMASYAKVLVLTKGADGADVIFNNQKLHYPAFPVKEVDSTGAGDVFTAAFLAKYAETKDIALSTGFAHSAASFIVEGVGIKNLATIEQINDRFEKYKSTNIN